MWKIRFQLQNVHYKLLLKKDSQLLHLFIFALYSGVPHVSTSTLGMCLNSPNMHTGQTIDR